MSDYEAPVAAVEEAQRILAVYGEATSRRNQDNFLAMLQFILCNPSAAGAVRRLKTRSRLSLVKWCSPPAARQAHGFGRFRLDPTPDYWRAFTVTLARGRWMSKELMPEEIRDLIVRHIDSVAPLEALLFLHARSSELWDVATVADTLIESYEDWKSSIGRPTRGRFHSPQSLFLHLQCRVRARSRGAAADFIATPRTTDFVSQMVGVEVYNDQHQDLARIEDIAVGKDGHVQAFILDVGEYLGPVAHFVAVKPSALTIEACRARAQSYSTG
jgi:hypothetical protein